MELSLIKLVLAYVVGGITFLPLLLLFFFVHSYVTLPRRQASPSTADLTSGEEEHNIDVEKKRQNSEDELPNVAAGYFAVCREYAPGGVNGKPPPRTTPAGQTIASENPGLYSSLYRSMFERKTAQPTVESGKTVKRANNIFYVVLRHSHLILFDHEEQLEVRHVISLNNYEIRVHGAEDPIPEGELWVKRNCIKLSPRKNKNNSTPYFLFSDNCSEKEDFYHALLRSQRSTLQEDEVDLPEQLPFQSEDMIKLIRNLHVSEENAQTRWLNALFGRIFLAIYQTRFLEDLVANKIKRKISRVHKPTFIPSVTLQKVHLGDGAPSFTNPKLREMGIDGNLIVEMDVKYSGNFKIVVAALARIEVPRFKAREVDLVLSGTLKSLHGHLLIKLKPPPSNRIWISFETVPRLDLEIEPIVSSRQITYGFILQAIKSRILEVVSETLVLPNWDDVPFKDTIDQTYRGAIWKDSKTTKESIDVDAIVEAKENLKLDLSEHLIDQHEEVSSIVNDQLKHNESTAAKDTEVLETETGVAVSPPSSPPLRSLRTQPFTTAATPSPAVVTRIPVTSRGNPKRRGSYKKDAQSSMRSLSSQALDSLAKSNTTDKTGHDSPDSKSIQSLPEKLVPSSEESIPSLLHGTDAIGSIPDLDSDQLSVTSSALDMEQHNIESPSNKQSETQVSPNTKAGRIALNQSISSATAAAKRWGLGLGAFQRQNEPNISPLSVKALREPMGRGSPLPPPGQPLPGPQSKGWSMPPQLNLARKPVPTKDGSPSESSGTPATTAGKSLPVETMLSEVLAKERKNK